MTTNDPAERLLMLPDIPVPDADGTMTTHHALLDQALAVAFQNGRQEAIDSFTERMDGIIEGAKRAERRATVERIRAALLAWSDGLKDGDSSTDRVILKVLVILDAEAGVPKRDEHS